MKKKLLSVLCIMTLIFGSFAWMIPTRAFASDENSIIIEDSAIPLSLWYDEEAPAINENKEDTVNGTDEGWERWSLPIGNGYVGANVFGRTDTERIQISEKTLANPHKSNLGGLNSFSETYIDFGHTSVSDYRRYLDLNTAISGVEYISEGVKYTREYFVSYPDKAVVIRLDSDSEGALSFTLRPTIPYEQAYMSTEDDGKGKTGSVVSSVQNGVGYIELSGNLEYFDMDFLGIYKVYTNGGTITASTTENNYTDRVGIEHNDIDGTIVVEGAKSAYIVLTLDTDYELSSEMFTSSDANKPTHKTDLEYTRTKVESYMASIDEKIEGKNFDEAYALLKNAHIADYSELFGRVSLDLDYDEADLYITTDELLKKYETEGGGAYLEMLAFQYGRYLLIASSREGTMPAHLQGVWNTYNSPPWSSGYWYNINIQMCYWPAFSTNLADTFGPYVDYCDAFMERAEANADDIVRTYHELQYGKDGGNGWCIGVGNYQHNVYGERSSGNLGFTTQLFWDWYEYTGDESILQSVYDKLVSAARYITKTLEQDENGNYLVSYCDSPEMFVDGIWYYTVGTTYAQSFAYLNNYNALSAAKALGIDITDTDLLSKEEYSILSTILEQIDKYDPINVGLSGQIKEFRQEDYYGSVGDEPQHRHTSQLVGLYPGNLINATTPAWIDAAIVSLENRGYHTTGWGLAFRMCLWARAKDGDGAYVAYNTLIKDRLATNLWDLHPPFQIDGNIGLSAGVAEMLLQSHDGYISPLAALPSEWSNGSYTGLVARGNFEVSAAWENGLANTFNITSRNGGEASVYYPGITSANVVTANGKKVEYTVSGKDMITFDTEKDETYIISGFRRCEVIEAPESFSYERDGRFGTFTLDWTPVSNAVSYNIYVAVENAPTYTLVTNTNDTNAIYVTGEDEWNARTTFAVTAVASDGTESERKLCYSNPEDTSAKVEKISASVNESGELQVVVSANENAAKYKLYEKTENASKYVLISESGFPVLYAEGYKETSKYAVSVVSYYTNEESRLYTIDSFTSAPLIYNAANIFEGKKFDAVASTDTNNTWKGYEIEKLTDGSIASSTGRFALKTSNKLDATIDLGDTYVLSELRFYIYDRNTALAGTNFTVQVYSDGKWVSVVENLSNEEIANNYCKSINSSKTGLAVSIDLGFVKGSKIRVYAESIGSNGITFYEGECSGIMLDSKYCYSDNILLGKEFISSEAVTVAGGETFGYDKLTDGIISSTWNKGRYSSVGSSRFYATVDLGGLYKLDKIRIYDFEQNAKYIGKEFKLEIYANGKWTQLVSIADTAGFEPYRISKGSEVGEAWIEFDLGNMYGEKIRISSNYNSGTTVTLYEIECSGTMIHSKQFAYSDNILLGKDITSNEPVMSGGGVEFGYDRLNDGIIVPPVWTSGRYAGSNLDATIDLGASYRLYDLKLYVFEGNYIYAGKNFKVEVYSDGKWTTAISIPKNADLEAYLVSRGNGVGQSWLEIDLEGIVAEKIRITSATQKSSVTFYEIECSGILYSDNVEKSDNVFSGKEFIGSEPVTTAKDGTVFSYSKLTDGLISSTWTGRYASGSTGKMNGTLNLGGVYQLNKMRFYDFEHNHQFAGKNFKIELYIDGSWYTAVYVENNDDLANYRVTVGTGTAQSWLEFDFGGAFAEKVRISATSLSGKTVTFNELECSGTKVPSNSYENFEANSLHKADAIINGGNASADNPASNMFDGSLDTYTEVKNTASYTVTVDFAVPEMLYTLKIYELIDSNNLINGILSTASNDTMVEIYRDGAWIKIADNISLNSDGYTEIYIYGTECTKIRITFTNTRKFDGESTVRSAKIKEISCTSANRGYIDRKPLLEAYKNVAAFASNDSEYLSKMEIFKDYLTDTTLSAEKINECIVEMNQYAEDFLTSSVSKIDFTPKTSITLSSELIYNVYIPVESALKSFALDGITYDNLATLENIVTLSDGKQYYRFEIELPASEAARNIILKAVITVDGNDYNGTFTMSIPKYSKKVLESDANQLEKTLVKDVLAYIKAAYVYFDTDDKTEVVNVIDEILGDYKNTFAKVEGNTDADDGLWGVVIVLEEKPAVRFVLPEGVTADGYTFKSGNTTLEYTVGTMSIGENTHYYAEVSLYAYQMINEITYTDGTNSGTWHINSYYDFVTTDDELKNDANLISLVEKLYNYCKSAEAYRASVTNK